MDYHIHCEIYVLFVTDLCCVPLSCNAEVTKIETVCYQKWLTLGQRYKIGKKGAQIGVMLAISQPLRPSESM